MDVIKDQLRHPNLRIIERDRGLYESWNEGIAATTGKWIYISTAGDTIEREHLSKLVKAGEGATADVVISPCRYVDLDGRTVSGPTLRNPRIMSRYGNKNFVVEIPHVRDHVALDAGIQGLLGSCASDVFRGDFLRARPFPLEYGTHGDTAWMLRHAHEMRLCVVPEVGSTFCCHEKETSEDLEVLAETFDRIYAREIRTVGHLPGLALSLAVRALRSRRKRYARDGASFRGGLASLIGVGLRGLLATMQAPRKLRRGRSIRPLESF